MIKYALSCKGGHEFEAWFASSAAFDEQAAAKRIECPFCGSKQVSKALMAPAVATSKERRREYLKAIDAVREARAEMLKDADNVGDNFASEARKIHYEETPQRSIYGKATDEEAKALREEGVEFTPLPVLPEDRN